MKKTLYSFVAFAAIAMTVASCSSDIENNNTPAAGKVTMTFSATQETSGATSRTALDATDATKVNWLSTDAITVWDGTAKNAFTVSPKSDATTADISGSVTSGSTSFTAVYPNSVGQNCTYSDGSITGLVIPATQTATAGSYDPAAGIMTAQTTDENLAFKNVCAFLKITAAAAYTKIVVSTTSADIAGTFSVVPSTGVANVTTGVKEITLSGTIAQGSDYYIAIAPCSNVTGLTVKCYTSETEYVERAAASGKTPTFARGGVYNMGETTTENGWVTPPTSGKENGYDWVDLGLPSGVKWATCNVGADSPEEYGDYFAWGETTPYYAEGHSQDKNCSSWKTGKTGYNWASYSLCSGSYTKMTKYCNNSSYGTPDDMTTLESSDDAASINMGGTWRMPTLTECEELVANTYNRWTNNYKSTGKGGYIFYKKISTKTSLDDYTTDDAHIFLPAAGYRSSGSFEYDGQNGRYWSSSLETNYNYAHHAYSLTFPYPKLLMDDSNRYSGYSVRGVRSKN